MYIMYMYSIQYSAVLQYSMNSIVHTYYLSTHDTVYGRGGGGVESVSGAWDSCDVLWD